MMLASLSQRDLSARCGIAQAVIARIECGRTAPRADTLESLLSACGYELTLVPKAVDCLGHPAGSGGFEGLMRTAEDVDLDGLRVHVSPVEDLIAVKRASGPGVPRIAWRSRFSPLCSRSGSGAAGRSRLGEGRVAFV